MSRKGVACTAVLAVLAVSAGAAAQEGPAPRDLLRPAFDESGMRGELRPAYDPRGLRVGSFVVHPSVSVELAYDDNLFASRDNKRQDWRYTVQPALRILSNWRRHALDFTAELAHRFHRRTKSEDSTDWSARLDGRVDILRNTAFSLGGGYARRTEPRGIATAITDAAEPTRFDEISASVTLDQRFNRMTARLRGAFTDLRYEPVALLGGGSVSNRDRDRRIWAGEARLGYDISPDTMVFLRGAYNQVRYRLRPPMVGVDRNSEGYEAGIGSEFKITRFVTGTLFAGYRHQRFTDPLFDDVSGIVYGGEISWEVTPRTTVRLFGDSTIEETVLAGSSAVLSRSVGIAVAHELMRNIRLSSSGRFQRDDFRDFNRTDDSWQTDLRADYLMNRNLSFGLGYTYQHRRSSDPFFNFERDIIYGGMAVVF
jgi:hypothetical protein